MKQNKTTIPYLKPVNVNEEHPLSYLGIIHRNFSPFAIRSVTHGIEGRGQTYRNLIKKINQLVLQLDGMNARECV